MWGGGLCKIGLKCLRIKKIVSYGSCHVISIAIFVTKAVRHKKMKSWTKVNIFKHEEFS